MMSIERKAIWKVSVINECYVYCFSLRRSINSWNDHCIVSGTFITLPLD